MILSAEAGLAGVIGWPVRQSLSPRLHGYWLQRHGIDGAYVALPVRPSDFSAVLQCLPRMGFRGANITVPHKEAAASLVADLDETARGAGAVNTVVAGEAGRLQGRNTDVEGFLDNLDAAVPGWRQRTRRAVVIGAGGAARAVGYGLVQAGIDEIVLCNRTRERAETLAKGFGRQATILDWEARADGLEDTDLLVNTTTQGMVGNEPLDLSLVRLPTAALVTDIVYKPLLTPLLAEAQRRGNPTVDGLGMLLHQAKAGFEAWFGTRPVVDDRVREFVLGQADSNR